MARNDAIEPKNSMNRSVLIGAVLIVLALVAAIMAARPPPRTATQTAAAGQVPGPNFAGALRGETDFDFGSISMMAGSVSHRYLIKNAGAAPVLVRKIYTSCMCTSAMLVKGGRVINRYGMPGHGLTPSVNESLAPGEQAFIEVVFDPAAHGPAGIGPTERFVTIENDAGRPLELRFTANVRP